MVPFPMIFSDPNVDFKVTIFFNIQCLIMMTDQYEAWAITQVRWKIGRLAVIVS